MSYYGAKGDFYTGMTGYYRGDPGFFSSLFSGAKSVIGAAANYFTGGAASQVSQAVGIGGSYFAPPSAPAQPMVTAAGRASTPGYGTSYGGSGLGKRLSGFAANLPTMGTPATFGQRVATAPVMGGRGQPRYTKRGTITTRRRPRMHVTNPRALRRAIRRAHGFAKLARKCIAFTSSRPPKGRMHFKHRRRK